MDYEGIRSALSDLVAKTSPHTIHEVGCGEGYWVLRWNQEGRSAKRGAIFLKKLLISQGEMPFKMDFLVHFSCQKMSMSLNQALIALI